MGDYLRVAPFAASPSCWAGTEVDLAPALLPGRNVLVAVCRYYGIAGPWWLPAIRVSQLPVPLTFAEGHRVVD